MIYKIELKRKPSSSAKRYKRSTGSLSGKILDESSSRDLVNYQRSDACLKSKYCPESDSDRLIQTLHSDSLNSDSSTFPSDDPVVTLKKRSLHVPVRRTVEYDIRRKFITMISNVTNSNDFNLVYSFWKRLSCPHPTLRRMAYLPSTGFNQSPNLPSSIRLTGVNGITLYWIALLQLIPDHIVSFDNTKIITRSDTHGSIITASMCTKGTFVCEILPTEFMHSLHGIDGSSSCDHRDKLVDSLSKKALAAKKRKAKAEMLSLLRNPLAYYKMLTNTLPEMRKIPLPFSSTGSITIYLNGLKQIHGVELIANFDFPMSQWS